MKKPFIISVASLSVFIPHRTVALIYRVTIRQKLYSDMGMKCIAK